MAEALVHPPCRPATEHIRASVQQHEPSYALHGDDRMGYTLPVFMTFRQLKDENLMVTKGSHALPVTFYDITVKHKTTGEKISFDDYKSLPELQKQEYKVTPFMKHFYVFNIDQTDFKEKYPERYEGMRVRFSGPAVADNVKGNRNPWLDKMIKEQKWLCPIELKVQDRAYYSPSKDRIVLPAPGQFKDMESFQMTALTKWPTPPGIPHDWTAACITRSERADMPGRKSSPNSQLPSQAGIWE